jgi:hypothetical protein
MRTASLLAASLIASLPLAAIAQGIDSPPIPGTVVGQSEPGAPAAPGVPAAKVEKNAPYFGFSFGTGQGTITSGSTSWNFNDYTYFGKAPTTLAMQLRGGWGTGDFLFGAQMNLNRTWVDVNGSSIGMQFFAVDAVATWWSQEMGIYTRVGIGPSQFNAYAGSSTGKTYSGVELMAGFGVTMGGLGVGIDFTRQAYTASETGFDSVSYMLAMLSLDMY